ncbi:glycosyltransferase [Aestuariivivens insulae]|uniref:glycosyltransferase n=1 Tax=Aestuariivivens insulae TaxID=1621988 RepID=UPI001F59DA95|nr:glycosyltransferase [Aestuariivivens insulae]
MNGQIAVLLPHYNNYSGLQLTLESLLNETEGFTLFIIDDGSDALDSVKQIVKNFNNCLDVLLLVNGVNLGIVKTLNKGLEHIIGLNRYDFIARIDAGDICLSNRFKQQKEVLTNSKDVGLVGSWVRFVDIERHKQFDFKPPAYHKRLKQVIHLYNPFVHSAVMYRVEVVKEVGVYSEDYPALEDHAYFFNILKNYKATNITKILMECEMTSKGVSTKNRKAQTKSRIKLLLNEYNFTIIATIGVLRALITFIMPQSFLILLKKKVFYK